MKIAGAVLLGALLTPPLPITTIGAVRNAEGTITISWTLPVDPSVVGLTIFRERLDAFDETLTELAGLPTSLTDPGARFKRSYRYWVYTRNAGGELSDGAWVDVIDPDDVEDHHAECHASASTSAIAWPLVLIVALLLGVVRR